MHKRLKFKKFAKLVLQKKIGEITKKWAKIKKNVLQKKSKMR